MNHEIHTMQALRFSEFGEPPIVLHLVTMPRPALHADEVLVRIEAAAINPSDVKNVQGAMRSHTTLPRTPGRDFAGTVVDGPAELIGVPIWGTGGDLGFSHEGTHADFITLPSAAVAIRPSRLTAAEAASVGVGFVTAWTGLMESAAMQPGESVLVVGNGAVGSAVAQIARWQGAGRIFMTARSAPHTAASAADAAAVDTWIDLSSGNLAEQVKSATGGKGVPIVYNTVGGPLFDAGLHALSSGGRMVVIAAPIAEPKVSLNVLEFYRCELRLLGVNTLHQTVVESARRLNAMAPGFESGALTPPIVETRPLRDAPAAYEKVRSGSKAKIVLTLT